MSSVESRQKLYKSDIPRNLLNSSNSDDSLEMGFWGRSKIILLLPVVARPLVSQLFWFQGCRISRWYGNKKRGMKIGQVQTPQHLLILLIFSCFSWKKVMLSKCWNLLVNFLNSAKVDLSNFHHYFYEEAYIWRPWHYHYEDVPFS